MDSSKRITVISQKDDMMVVTERMLYESQIPVFLLSLVTGAGKCFPFPKTSTIDNFLRTGRIQELLASSAQTL